MDMFGKHFFLTWTLYNYAPVEGIDCELFTGEMAELIRRLKDLSASTYFMRPSEEKSMSKFSLKKVF